MAHLPFARTWGSNLPNYQSQSPTKGFLRRSKNGGHGTKRCPTTKKGASPKISARISPAKATAKMPVSIALEPHLHSTWFPLQGSFKGAPLLTIKIATPLPAIAWPLHSQCKKLRPGELQGHFVAKASVRVGSKDVWGGCLPQKTAAGCWLCGSWGRPGRVLPHLPKLGVVEARGAAWARFLRDAARSSAIFPPGKRSCRCRCAMEPRILSLDGCSNFYARDSGTPECPFCGDRNSLFGMS